MLNAHTKVSAKAFDWHEFRDFWCVLYIRVSGVWTWKKAKEAVWKGGEWEREKDGASSCCLERGESAKSWLRCGQDPAHAVYIFCRGTCEACWTLHVIVDCLSMCLHVSASGVRKKKRKASKASKASSSSSSDVMITSTENTDVIITRADGGREMRARPNGPNAHAAHGTIDLEDPPAGEEGKETKEVEGKDEVDETTYLWEKSHINGCEWWPCTAVVLSCCYSSSLLYARMPL